MAKILITSGGTKIPIDDVRHIGNMSSGHLGSDLAAACLLQGHQVIHLAAKGSVTPFLPVIDFLSSDNPNALTKVAALLPFKKNYTLVPYTTYDSYATNLKAILQKDEPAIVVLSAAVSDYGVKPIVGKISSSTVPPLELFPLPKLISSVKTFHPKCKLVGFKLLSGVSIETLIATASKSLVTNNCELVVANDLSDIRQGKHNLHLVSSSGVQVIDRSEMDVLAQVITT